MNIEQLDPLTITIEKKLADQPSILEAVKNIAIKILNTGMKPEDICIIYRIKPDSLKKIYQMCPEVKSLFDIKRIEYKSKILEVLSESATTGKDAKIATMLLEKHFAEEYDATVLRNRAKMAPDASNNTITQIVSFVREFQPQSPINPAAGVQEKSSVIDSAEIEARLENALLVKPQ